MNEIPQPPQPQKKKGLGPLAWIAIGCAGLVLLGIVAVGVGGFFVAKKGKELVEEMADNPAKTLAEKAIQLNPETELISSDEETVTFRTRDGEVMTMNFEDIRDGKFSVTDANGESSNISFGPSGITGSSTGKDGQETNFSMFGGGDTSNVPDEILYPGAESVSPTIASRGNGEYSGMLTYSTGDSMDEVVEWQAGSLGECNLSRTDVMGTRSAQFECGADMVTLTFTGEQGSLNVMVNYKIADD